MLTLPQSLRSALKSPMGPVFTEPEPLLATAGTPLVTVGDVVTESLLGHTTPAVAVIDDQTKRSPLDDTIDRQAFADELTVHNEAATISKELIEALGRAIAAEEPAVIVVDGEEDLATLPAILLLPAGASVVYGQPDAGMVLVTVDDQNQTETAALLDRMDGDTETARELLHRFGASAP